MSRTFRVDTVLVSRRVVLDEGVSAAAVGIADGRIARVEPADADIEAEERIDLGDLALLPGLVDTHVHVNDPGTDWEGFATAGRAAATGGVTTLVDMPLNSLPVTTSRAALEAKREAAAGACAVDYGFWGGVVPDNVDELEGLAAAGALGFKCFLSPSGLEEFPHVTREQLRPAMERIAASGSVLLVHAEDPGRLRGLPEAGTPEARDYATWLAARPPAAEVEAIRSIARLARVTDCAVHVVHVASAEAVDAVASAREAGTPLTAETCPHYLTFAAEEIPDGRPEYKCAPPIRGRRHRAALWRGLEEGVLDLVASDHSPCPPVMKCLDSGDLVAAWGGVSSLQLSVSAVWTGLATRGGSLATLARWMGQMPARLAGVDTAKGRIVAGRDADLVVFDPEAELPVDPEHLYHRHGVTPYAGMRLRGVVERTFLRGRPIHERGVDPEGEAEGREVSRG